MRQSTYALVFVGVCLLTGCDAVTPAETEQPAAAASTTNEDEPSATATLPEGVLALQVFEGEALKEQISGLDDALLTSDSGDFISIAALPEVLRTSGPTQGAHIQLSEDFETAAGGNFVRVTVAARSAENATLRVAYSTANVGNSGWQSFEMIDTFEEYSFSYRPKEPTALGAEFVGIAPLNGSADIRSVKVEALSVAPSE